MTVFEYKRVKLDLPDNHLEAMNLGFVDSDDIDTKIETVVNEQGQDGWEALYPFAVPSIWFRRSKTVRKNSKNG